jgi:hypothetical protein
VAFNSRVLIRDDRQQALADGALIRVRRSVGRQGRFYMPMSLGGSKRVGSRRHLDAIMATMSRQPWLFAGVEVGIPKGE